MTDALGARKLVETRRWRIWSVDVEVSVTDGARADEAARMVQLHLTHLDAAINRFRADSEIRRLPRVVSPLFARHLAAALEAARQTDGLIDPTIGGRLIELGYDADIEEVRRHAVERPSRPQPDWRGIDLAGPRLRVEAGTVLDLGSTSKALAADDCARALAESFDCGAVVALGGDVATAGPVPGGTWVVGVDAGVNVLGHVDTIALTSGCGVATSSMLGRRWRTQAGERHHLIDPRTGEPAVTPWVSVTVAARDCLTANIASTSAIILGESGPDWVEKWGLPARFVTIGGAAVLTSGWPTAQGAA